MTYDDLGLRLVSSKDTINLGTTTFFGYVSTWLSDSRARLGSFLRGALYEGYQPH